MLRSLNNARKQMDVLQKLQENTSANAANVNTAGYKFQELVQTAIAERDIYNNAGGAGNDQSQNLGRISMGTRIDEGITSFDHGNLYETGNPYDFAIGNDGFFVVETANGELAYTRNGSFTRNAIGELVTGDGLRVLGIDAEGNTSPISTVGIDFAVDGQGNISGTGMQLLVVDFQDYESLERSGGNLFSGTGEEFTLTDPDIQQGVLESSNVDILGEMVKMIGVSREFESNQRVLRTINETLEKTVNEIGRV